LKQFIRREDLWQISPFGFDTEGTWFVLRTIIFVLIFMCRRPIGLNEVFKFTRYKVRPAVSKAA
jgi:hypothetical protein